MKARDLVVRAGNHDRQHCPVSVELSLEAGAAATLEHLALHDEQGRAIPCQVVPTPDGDRAVVSWIVSDLSAGQERTYRLQPAGVPGAATDTGPGVRLIERGGGQLAVQIGGTPFTTYYYGRDVSRPYLHPLLGPYGQPLTRAFPMVPDAPGETRDHPHHRSFWVAHGEVNGTDNWSEGPRHSKQRHAAFSELVQGPILGTVEETLDWLNPQGNVVMTEERQFTFYNTPRTLRLFDVAVIFRASEGDVLFGDTKEGGVVSVRVATSMDVRSSRPRGGDWAPAEHPPGRIENAYGGINEEETWGKRAHWCDYSGVVAGQVVGVCIMDYTTNLRHPTYWHVRNYGLMTANPFGIHEFRRDPAQRGEWTLPAGASRTFRYRIAVHAGDAREANLRDRYHDFINPPTVIPVS